MIARDRNRSRFAVLPGYVLLTVVLTWPLTRDLERRLPTVVPLPDALLQAYILDWDVHTLFRAPGRVFDAPMFHPERRTLTYMDHLLGEAVVAAPVYAATRDPAIAYNAVVLFAVVVSAWGPTGSRDCSGSRARGASSPGSCSSSDPTATPTSPT